MIRELSISKISRKPLVAIAELPLAQWNRADSSVMGNGIEKLPICKGIIIETCVFAVLGMAQGS